MALVIVVNAGLARKYCRFDFPAFDFGTTCEARRSEYLTEGKMLASTSLALLMSIIRSTAANRAIYGMKSNRVRAADFQR